VEVAASWFCSSFLWTSHYSAPARQAGDRADPGLLFALAVQNASAERTVANSGYAAAHARQQRVADKAFLKGLARAFGGATIFSLPMLMTMEMWQLGFAIEPVRLVLLLLLLVPLLVGLSHYIGFENTFCWEDDVVDAFVAYAVGFIAALPVLALFGAITFDMALAEVVGKVAVQAVPGSIGALLAQSQFGGEADSRKRKEQRGETYGSETFFMAVGAVFLSLNVAPTEEIVLISFQMTAWHALVLALVSILLMHAFVYTVEFHGQSIMALDRRDVTVFLRYTLVGYAICLVISTYVLWTFGRTEGMPPIEMVMASVVLAFPASVGAAAARLIL
jgi:putative integral membrane protein (TIGR02587 family)